MSDFSVAETAFRVSSSTEDTVVSVLSPLYIFTTRDTALSQTHTDLSDVTDILVMIICVLHHICPSQHVDLTVISPYDHNVSSQ